MLRTILVSLLVIGVYQAETVVAQTRRNKQQENANQQPTVPQTSVPSGQPDVEQPEAGDTGNRAENKAQITIDDTRSNAPAWASVVLSFFLLVTILFQAWIYKEQLKEMRKLGEISRTQASMLKRQVATMRAQTRVMEAQVGVSRQQGRTMRSQVRQSYKQVDLMRESLEIAERSANAARDAAEAAKGSLFYSQRAFVFLKHFEVIFDFNRADKTIEAATIYARWENLGPTPALNGKNRVVVKIVDKVEDSMKIPPDTGGGFHELIIGPGAQMTGAGIAIPLRDLERCWKDQARIFIWAVIDYGDVFPETKRHNTSYCGEMIFYDDLSGRSFPSAQAPIGLFEIRSFGSSYSD